MDAPTPRVNRKVRASHMVVRLILAQQCNQLLGVAGAGEDDWVNQAGRPVKKRGKRCFKLLAILDTSAEWGARAEILGRKSIIKKPTRRIPHYDAMRKMLAIVRVRGILAEGIIP